MIIRRAAHVDAARIAAMEAEYIDLPWTEAQIAEEISNADALFYVAEETDVVGFLSGVCAADECEVSDIAVDKAYRRRGIATALFSALTNAAAERGVKSIYLLVRADNAPAIALYKSLGFIGVGTRRGYYGDADATIMRRDTA